VSFLSEKVWRGKISRVFAPKKSGGAKHREFFVQKSLVEENIMIFLFKKVWRRETS